MRIVLTGFGPFPGVAVNPSAHLVECLPLDLPPLAGHHVRVVVLPVTWRACQEWVEQELPAERPDILLHVGLRASASGFDLERVGRNICRVDLPDAEGTRWPTSIIEPGGPEWLESTLPLQAARERLTWRGIDAGLSDDAGGYLCNFILYQSLRWIQRQSATTWAGFLHIPRIAGLDSAHPDEGLPPYEHVRLLVRLLEALIDLRQRSIGPGSNIAPTATL